jgi:hypothetical protein
MHAHGEIQLEEWKAYAEEKEAVNELSIGADAAKKDNGGGKARIGGDVGFPRYKLRTKNEQVLDQQLRAIKHRQRANIANEPDSEEEVYLFAEVIIDHIFKLKALAIIVLLTDNQKVCKTRQKTKRRKSK